MQLVDAGHRHRLLGRVDDAAVAARRQHHETAILHVKDGRMLVVMLVGNGLAQEFGRRVVRGVAAEAVRRLAELLERIGQDLFVGFALDLAGRESVADDDRRALAQHDADVARRQRAPVEIAEVAELAGRAGRLHAMAEIVLAAGIELDVGRQHASDICRGSRSGRRSDRSGRG